MASKRVPTLLALEVEDAGSTENPGGSAPVDRPDGDSECDVGQERIAAELLVKLGVRLSPRTVRRYMPPRATPRTPRGSQAWSTFVRNHARSVLASDFFIAVTARFRILYVFV